MKFKILFDAAPADGNGNEPVTDQEPPAAPPTPETKPPAAEIVNNGQVTEETAELKKKLADIEAEKRRVEMRASELEDENHQLRKVTPTPVRKIDTRSALERFMAGEEV